MDRRRFLLNSSLATGGMLLVPQFLKALGRQPLLEADQRTLVVLQLGGGNDGLNTIVPYRNDLYYQLRPRIGIKPENVLKVEDDLGFHPALKGLRRLYDDGHLSVVNNVGYPNPNRSHFRSMDIWHTASNSDEYRTTGWLGHYLDSHCEKPHQAIEVSDQLSLAMKGELRNGLAVQDAAQLHSITAGPWFQKLAQEGQHGHDHSNVDYLYKTTAETVSSAQYVHETSRLERGSDDYPGDKLAKQLRTVARFIKSGVGAKVYYVSVSGFDTHANQTGAHERLLKTYDGAVSAFIKDLKKSGHFDQTMLMVFSEFGRRAKQNGSNGTDHGTAGSMYLIGKNLKQPGFYNPGPDLADLDKNGDLKFKIDFRRVYASVLDRWLLADSEVLLGQTFENLGVI